MLCYRDTTFCSSNCTNTDCHRHFGEAQQKAADLWWGKPGAPVMFADFSVSCPAYQAPKEEHAA